MKIKQLRLSRNLTQLEFAQIIGVKRTTLSNWELNRANPSVSILKKIAQYFNCSIEDLI